MMVILCTKKVKEGLTIMTGCIIIWSIFSSHLEIINSDAWTQLNALKDPELKRLAQSLPQTVPSCRADSTTKNYLYAFGSWKDWVESKGEVMVFPV